MIIELGNIHVNVNYLYLRWGYYQQIRKRPIEAEGSRGSVIRSKDEMQAKY